MKSTKELEEEIQKLDERISRMLEHINDGFDNFSDWSSKIESRLTTLEDKPKDDRREVIKRAQGFLGKMEKLLSSYDYEILYNLFSIAEQSIERGK